MDPRFEELAGQITRNVTEAVTKNVTAAVTKNVSETVTRNVTEAVNRYVTDVVAAAEARLAEHVQTRLDAAEARLSAQAKANVEDVKSQVRLAAEGYAGTLDSINQRLDRIETGIANGFANHGALLKNHERRITALEDARD